MNSILSFSKIRIFIVLAIILVAIFVTALMLSISNFTNFALLSYISWASFLFLVPGFSIWQLLKKFSKLSLNGVGITIFMSIIFGLAYVGLASWILLELNIFGIAEVILCQLPFCFFLTGKISGQRKNLNLDFSFDVFAFLSIAIIGIVLMVFALGSNWFSITWNSIPWNDTWTFWGRGYQAATTGHLFSSWLFSTSGSGVSTFISALLGSIFVILPNKVASLLFMKIFSIALIFLTAVGIFFTLRNFISRFREKIPAFYLILAPIVFISSTWALYYSYYFVREVLGTPVLIAIIFSCFQKMPRTNINRIIFISCFCALGNLLFYISPLTWIYFLPVFAVILVINLFLTKISIRLWIITLFLLCLPLLPIIYERFFWMKSTTSFLVSEVVSGSQSSSTIWSYNIVNSCGLIVYSLSLIAVFFLVFKLYREKPRFNLLIAVAFPLAPFILSFFIPFLPLSFLGDRYAYYLSISTGFLTCAFLSLLSFQLKDKKFNIRLGRSQKLISLKKLLSFIMIFIIVFQVSNGLIHASSLDNRSDSEVINMLLSADKSLPTNCTVVVDSFDSEQMLYKATGLLAPRQVVDWSVFKNFSQLSTNISQFKLFVNMLEEKNIVFLWVNASTSSLSNYVLPLINHLGDEFYNLSIDFLGSPTYMNAGFQQYSTYMIQVVTKSSGFIVNNDKYEYGWSEDSRPNYNTAFYSHGILADFENLSNVLFVNGSSLTNITDAWVDLSQPINITTSAYDNLVVCFKTSDAASFEMLLVTGTGTYTPIFLGTSDDWTTRFIPLNQFNLINISEIVVRSQTNNASSPFCTYIYYMYFTK